MKKGVENMYKRDKHYNEKVSKADLEIEISKHYKNEHGLIIQVISNCVQDDLIETRHGLSCANSELWSLNDWPVGEGFGSSDRHSYIDRVKESIAFERKFLQAETELVSINNLEESPKNDDVRSYMRMNDKIAEGLVA